MSLTPEQQAIRRVRVTASTLPAFMGYSAYNSPADEWARHLGVSANVSNSATEIGQELEEGIAKASARVLGLSFADLLPGPQHPRATQGVLIHPAEDFLAATPDYLIVGATPPCGIQIKKHAPHMVHTYHGRPGDRGEWDNGLVPIAYELQCQIEMMVVAGVEGAAPLFWYLSAYFGGNEPRPYKIRRNEKVQRSLLNAGRAFWAECIDPNGPRRQPDPARWPWRLGPQPKRPRPAPKLDRDSLLSAPLPELPMSECELPAPTLLRSET